MANEVKFKLGVEGGDAVRREFQSLDVSLQSVAKAGDTMGRLLKSSLAGFSASMTIGKLVSVQREFDVLNSSLITVTGSSANAAKEMAWIKTFAKDTPFGLAQATQGFVKMKALGLDPTIGSLTSFGNTASAMGKDLNQMIEAVADASTGEFERLKEFGIVARKQGDEVKLTFQGVTTTIGNNAKEITGYLEAIGNNEFASATALRAKTLDGAIAALGDTWDELFRTVSTNNAGSLIYDGVTLATRAIEDATTVLNSMTSAAQANARETGAMATIQGGLATVFETVAVLGANVKYVLVQIGNEIGGIAAQAALFVKGGAGAGIALEYLKNGRSATLDQMAAVRTAMVEDGKAARREVDATTAAILMAREHAKTAGAINAQANARLARQSTDAISSVTTAAQTHTAATKAQEAATKAAAKAQEELVKAYTAQAQTLGDARNKEYDDIDKYMAAQRLAAIEAGNAADAAVRAAQLELDQRDMLKSGIAETTAARLEEQLATKTAGTEAYDSLVRQIEAQKQLAGIYRKGEALDAVDDLTKENKKAAEESGKYWEDALMRAFESGKGFFESLWDTIKNTMKTQVLKVAVQGVMGTLGIGAAGAAAAGTGGGTDILGLSNMASSVSNAYNGISGLMTIGSQTLAGTMSAANALGTIAANATGTGITGLLATNGAYGTAAAGTASAAAGSATAGLAAIPGWGWAALGVAALAGSGLFDGGGGPKTDSSYNMGGLGDSSATGLAGTYATGVEAAWTTLAKQLDLTTKLKVGALTSIDTAGDAQTIFDAYGTVNGQIISSRAGRMGGAENVGRDEAALQAAMAEETTRILFAALKASDLPDDYKKYLDSVAGNSEAMTAAINSLGRYKTSLSVANAWMAMLNKNLFDTSLAGAQAASSLADAFGSLDNLAASSKAYYDLFYTDAEKVSTSVTSLSKAMALVGVSAPSTDQAFKDTVKGLDLTTAAGRNTFAVLLTLAPEFAATTAAIDKLATDTAAKLMKAFTANGALTPALDTAALKMGNVASGAGTLTTSLTTINKIMGDASSGTITLGGKITTLGTGMTASQQSAVLLNAQIVSLQTNADKARINFAGLTTALAGVNTETFVATITLVFESLAERIGGVIDSITAERIAVREAALQIINPTVMSKAQIQRDIATINTKLPGNTGVVAAGKALTAADALYTLRADQKAANTNRVDVAYAAKQAANAAVTAQKSVSTEAVDLVATYLRFGNLNNAGVGGPASLTSLATYNDSQASMESKLASKPLQDILTFAKTLSTLSLGGGDYSGAEFATQAAQYKAAIAAQAAAGPAIAGAVEAAQREYDLARGQITPTADRLAAAGAALTAAEAAAKKATLDYTAAMQNFTIDASKSVGKLTRLREETVKYYEAQKALADLMSTSAAGLRDTVATYRYNQLTPDAQAASLQSQFTSAYSLALASQGDGETLAGYGDKLNGLLGPLIDKLAETGKTSQIASYLAQAESVATLIEKAVPVNYQADSLALLGTIDSTLASLDAASKSAERIISDAVKAGSDRTADGLRAVIAAIKGGTVPAFASGGYHSGGIRLVGENGPELEVTGPSRILNNDQTLSLLSPRQNGDGTAALAREVSRLTAVNERLEKRLEAIERNTRSGAVHSADSADTLRTLKTSGVQVWTDPAEPIQTVAA